MSIPNLEFNNLADLMISEGHSMVIKSAFNSIYHEKHKIDLLDGDIVECGVWRGGMSLFLTKLFPNKKIWLADSYDGFQDIDEALYKTDKVNDPHVKGSPIRQGLAGMPLERVKELFNTFGEGANPNVNYLKGYVKDTLEPKTCPIDKIALLRIDVDAYSATKEVLEFLYPKVVSGGMIIFDDANIGSARVAIEEFYEKESITISHVAEYPDTCNNYIVSGLGGESCYIFKK